MIDYKRDKKAFENTKDSD